MNALKHGFYSTALLPGEAELYDAAVVGDLEQEIRLAKVKLHRFVRLSGSADLETLVDEAIEVIQKREAVLTRRRKPTRDDVEDGSIEDGQAALKAAFNRDLVDKTEIRAAAPNYAELVIKQLEIVRKLELSRAQMILMAKKADEDAPGDTAPTGFEVVEYDDEEAEA